MRDAMLDARLRPPATLGMLSANPAHRSFFREQLQRLAGSVVHGLEPVWWTPVKAARTDAVSCKPLTGRAAVADPPVMLVLGPTRPSRPQRSRSFTVPRAMRALVERCLAQAPVVRPSAQELLEAFASWRSGSFGKRP